MVAESIEELLSSSLELETEYEVGAEYESASTAAFCRELEFVAEFLMLVSKSPLDTASVTEPEIASNRSLASS